MEVKDNSRRKWSYIDGWLRQNVFFAPVLGGVRHSFLLEQNLHYLSYVFCLFVSGLSFTLYKRRERNFTDIRKTWLETIYERFLPYFLTKPIIVWLGIFLLSCRFGSRGNDGRTNLPYIKDELLAGYESTAILMASFPLGYANGSVISRKSNIKSRRILMLGGIGFIGGLTIQFSLGFINSINHCNTKLSNSRDLYCIFQWFITQQMPQTRPQIYDRTSIFCVYFFIRSAMPLGV